MVPTPGAFGLQGCGPYGVPGAGALGAVVGSMGAAAKGVPVGKGAGVGMMAPWGGSTSSSFGLQGCGAYTMPGGVGVSAGVGAVASGVSAGKGAGVGMGVGTGLGAAVADMGVGIMGAVARGIPAGVGVGVLAGAGSSAAAPDAVQHKRACHASGGGIEHRVTVASGGSMCVTAPGAAPTLPEAPPSRVGSKNDELGEGEELAMLPSPPGMVADVSIWLC